MNKTLIGSIALAVLVGAPSALAGDDATVITELRDRIGDLETRLARHETDWISDQRADEIRTIVEDVLADADVRASLLQSGATSGYDGGFNIASGDGAFSLRINGHVQVRSGYNDADDQDDRHGTEIRRAKVKFKGHVIDPSWKYFINGAFDRGGNIIGSSSGGTFSVEDVGIIKDLGNGWEITFGQVKLPFTREELVSSSRQLTVDRSLVNETFNLDRGQGVMATYTGDTSRFMIMFSDGARSRNTKALDPTTDYALTARYEGAIRGSLKQFKDFSNKPSADTGLLIGVAGHVQEGEDDSPIDNLQQVALTADVSYEGDGWNAFAAVIYNGLDPDSGSSLDQYGVVVQGGMFVNDVWELFARYEWADLDISSLDDISILTVGANNYINKNVKWTTDLGYGFDSVPVSSSGILWRSDVPGKDGQFVVRSQLQLTF